MADQSGNGKAGKKGPSGRSYRNATGLTRQPKKMRGRKVSSQRWLTRQLNDPFVAEAKSRGFRSRAALKLEQMDDRYQLLKPGMAIVDLGCAPGGWLQVASIRTKLGTGSARLVGIDLLETEGVVGADIFTGDMTDPEMLETVRQATGGAADGVLSDMAADTTGHRATDHLRTTALLEAALDFALDVLNADGFFSRQMFSWRCREISTRCDAAQFQNGSPCKACGEPFGIGRKLCACKWLSWRGQGAGYRG